uniref:General secretion pathway protein GspM n=1 Tax=Caenorhabditis tropicalis TaxID=1561998 RepID=A0A1I7UDL9_9PELO
MKVFALGLDENQKAEQRENDLKDTKIPIDSVSSGVPLQTPIVLAKAPRRHFTGFTCGLLSWFIGACCLVLLCLAISEVAYHRQRDQAFLRLKWAELRQRMMGYELLSQQQELDRMALEKQSPVESLPLRRSDDPIKPKIVDAVQPSQDSPKTDYAEEQTEKFGFLQALMDKIRKHAQSMGLNGDMQVHVVEVKPIGFGGQNNKENSVEENASVSF